MSKIPVNPFALGAAFVERAVELGWIEIETDGRRSAYFLTESGNEGLEGLGVKLEKAMQFATLPERINSGPRKRSMFRPPSQGNLHHAGKRHHGQHGQHGQHKREHSGGKRRHD